MKKLFFLVVLVSLTNIILANGLITNTNQSVQFTRMMSRNASLGIDATYYNPAGLIKLEDGWHFSINNQTILQTRTIDSKFPSLNNGIYEGKVNIPVFPSAFAVYKMERWALSFGAGPNAGGGQVEYNSGLPSFEIPISKFASGLSVLTPLLQANQLPTVSGYEADLSFNGSSAYLGFQLGITYEINEMLSVFGGARYVPAKNTYYGEISDISLNTTNGPVQASNYLDLVSPVIDGAVNQLKGATNLLATGISGGQVDPDAQVSNPDLIAILALVGNTAVTNQQALGILSSTQEGLVTLQNTDVSNKMVDVEQSGAGITPIIGFNLSPNEFLNIGVKYEHKTYMTVENSTTEDDLGLFPNGAISRNDVPGVLGVGIGLTDNYWFETQLSFNYYFDKYVSWGGNVRDISVWESLDPSQIREQGIDNNSFDVALGLQFNVSEYFSISGGGMYQKAGVADSFNSDFEFASPSYTALGGGIMYKVNDQLTLDLGANYIIYKDVEARFDDPFINTTYSDFYGKESFSVAVGLSYSIPY